MGYGGFHPYPRRFGGGRTRIQGVLDGLNADRGDTFEASDRTTTVYVINMAVARAIAAAWGTNQRLANLWVPACMAGDLLSRWEKLLAIVPKPTDDESTRRAVIEEVLARFAHPALSGEITTALEEALGDAFVAIETISYANAFILVPDGTYPWGVVGAAPWSSTVAHILIKLQKPTGWTERDFYAAAAKVSPILDSMLPAWTTFDWYRAGPISVNVSGGPSAGGFFLDDDHNLDNEVFDV